MTDLTPEQRAILARVHARQQDFATLTAGDRDRLATRRTARREHKAAARERKQDRRALESSEGPIWLTPTDPPPAPRKRAGKPIPFTPTGR